MPERIEVRKAWVPDKEVSRLYGPTLMDHVGHSANLGQHALTVWLAELIVADHSKVPREIADQIEEAVEMGLIEAGWQQLDDGLVRVWCRPTAEAARLGLT